MVSSACVPGEQALEQLVGLPGIGPWSAEMILLFHVRRPDVWSPGDAGLQQAVCALYEIDRKDFKAQHEEIAAAWAPQRSLACRYLWAWLGVQKDLKKANG